MEINSVFLIISYNMLAKFNIDIKFGDINWLKSV